MIRYLFGKDLRYICGNLWLCKHTWSLAKPSERISILGNGIKTLPTAVSMLLDMALTRGGRRPIVDIKLSVFRIWHDSMKFAKNLVVEFNDFR
jgi:hypothetical protein